MSWVYIFGDSSVTDSEGMRILLGGKGAALSEMSRCGLPVPPGFTITTRVCEFFYKNNYTYPDTLKDSVLDGIRYVEKSMNKKFGDPNNPLLFAVRSGARVSMPGMLDTILNLGMNDEVCSGMAKKTTTVFACDSYRRFIHMYGNVVHNIPNDLFEKTLSDLKKEVGVILDRELQEDHLFALIERYKSIYYRHVNHCFPQNPEVQLWESIGAIFKSWLSERAVTYRRLNKISDNWGTAANIQAMVFGNMGSTSATGVAFTRNPSTGEKKFFGEYLINAQGEDVVAGIRTPEPLDSLKEIMPHAFEELLTYRDILEKHYKDMQDIEFTIENNKVYLLQTRSGKRTIWAALKIACDMIDEGVLTEEEALLSVNPESLHQVLHPHLDSSLLNETIASGLPASPGAAKGAVCFDARKAHTLASEGVSIILVRPETSPEDICGMAVAKGILTVRGGLTSHAAVVARGMGVPCIVGAGQIHIDEENAYFQVNKLIVREGEIITIDGTTGGIFLGDLPMIAQEPSESYDRIMHLADKIRRMDVRANADTSDDAQAARALGASGIGLCRTEHMFFDSENITVMREMIIAATYEDRMKALNKLLPVQKQDFKNLFLKMHKMPVTIRLLDPPLHEFLPKKEQDFVLLAEKLDVPVQDLKVRTEQLTEHNPMLGHRGCRLLNTYQEITRMQARAIFEAAAEIQEDVLCEIMIPFVSLPEELNTLIDIIHETAKEVTDMYKKKPCYIVGAMIELPRACMLADLVAKRLSFVSFGTNDLTQTTFGVSRDDAAVFLESYKKKGIIQNDPFSTLDTEGVGALMKIALEKIPSHVKAGICGEHGGDPASIDFFEKIGLSYVSCSPFRVPIARLAAAQAYIRNRKVS